MVKTDIDEFWTDSQSDYFLDTGNSQRLVLFVKLLFAVLECKRIKHSWARV